MQARMVALDMLLAVAEEGKASHKVFAAELSKYPDIKRQERAFARRLAAGVTERRLTLDYLLSRYAKTRTGKLKPVIREILRMGIYQLYYMDVPPSAACNEAVKLAKKRGFSGLCGYVNGVLRAAAREKVDLQKEVEGLDSPKALSILYSVPEWLVENFITWYGEECSTQIFAAFLEPSRLTVRVNQSVAGVNACRERFQQAGVSVVGGYLHPAALHLSGIDTVGKLPGFLSGDFQVQDESSMLPVLCAGIKAGDYVIDCCAAPGGKTIQAADALYVAEGRMQGTLCSVDTKTVQEKSALYDDGKAGRPGDVAAQGLISARDLSELKISKIRENKERCGFGNIEVMSWDALLNRQEDIGRADVVIADLPCSGLGIIGKKPDIKYNVSQEGLSELSLLQKKILGTVAEYVKPGGVLVYSTCTLNPGENEENFRFLCGLCGLEPESLNGYLPKELHSDTTRNGYLTLLPEAGKWDGFFVSRFRRKGGGTKDGTKGY